MTRSRVELLGLEYEAERLVREGMSRAEVSRMLGVHVQTLAQWALRGRWRKKDLDLERSAETTRRTIRNVKAAHERRDLEREALEAQVAIYRAAYRLISENGHTGNELADLIAGLKELPKLAAPEAAPEDPTIAGKRSLGEVRLDELSGPDEEDETPVAD